MRKIFLSVIALVCAASLAHADLNWLTDYDAAKTKAKIDNKLVLLDFTGSDWCIWCKRLNAEVFSKPQFQDYASKNLILVELDFPRAKDQNEALRKQNQKLAGEYQVEGFPTVVVLNSQGKMIGTLGYAEGGVDAFIAELEKLRKS